MAEKKTTGKKKAAKRKGAKGGKAKARKAGKRTGQAKPEPKKSAEPKGKKAAQAPDRGSGTKKKAGVVSVNGSRKGDVALPGPFQSQHRPDLIRRAFVFERSLNHQPHGSDPRAGFRTTADYYSRRRDYYRLTVNRGISRLPRQKRPGGGLGEVRRVPQSKGGHRAHPPKAEKKRAKKMNEKEWILALKSAVGATADPGLVRGDGRNHAADGLDLPLIVEDSFESFKKTAEVSEAFGKLGLSGDRDRAAREKTKSGKARTGKSRPRKSVLVVVSGDCPAMRAAANLAGVEVTDVDALTVSLLAPGGNAGRLTLWTEGAISKISS